MIDMQFKGELAPAPGIEASRFKSFSDGIFAIILTIMIFSLKSPSSEGIAWLEASWPTVVAYALSYMFVAVCWFNHHFNLRNIERVQTSLIWVNFLFLFWMSFLPFTTSYLAERHFSPFSVFVYAVSFLPMVASYMILECLIAFGRHGDHTHQSWLWIAMLRGVLTLVFFGSAAALAFSAPGAAFIVILLTPLLWIFPDRMTQIGIVMHGRRNSNFLKEPAAAVVKEKSLACSVSGIASPHVGNPDREVGSPPPGCN